MDYGASNAIKSTGSTDACSESCQPREKRGKEKERERGCPVKGVNVNAAHSL